MPGTLQTHWLLSSCPHHLAHVRSAPLSPALASCPIGAHRGVGSGLLSMKYQDSRSCGADMAGRGAQGTQREASPLSGGGGQTVSAPTPKTPTPQHVYIQGSETAYPVTLTCGDWLNTCRNFRSGQIEQTPGTCQKAPPHVVDTHN